MTEYRVESGPEDEDKLGLREVRDPRPLLPLQGREKVIGGLGGQ